MTDTQFPRLPNPRHRWWSLPLAAVAVLTMLAVVVFALLPSGLVATNAEGVDTPYALVPAAAEQVTGRVSYGDLPGGVVVDTDPDGRIHFVTVSEPPQSVLGYWVSRVEPEIDFLTHEDKYGTQTPSQVRTVALRQMRTASQNAQFVALTVAGFEPQRIPGPVQVDQFLCLERTDGECAEWVPSQAVLERGDTIVAVDGEPVEVIEELSAALGDNEPGDTVDLTVERIDAGELDVDDVELVASSDGTDRAIIGFLPFDTDSVDLPFEVDIDTGEIGGPSAGLAFTLTLIDELTGGELLGGHDVAVTGTIDINGNVGGIGGLVQKASAVHQAGIDYFVVPARQGEDGLAAAREVVGDDVEIIAVATIDDALAALAEIGGETPEVLVS